MNQHSTVGSSMLARIVSALLALLLLVALPSLATAQTTLYVNDDDTSGDVFTSEVGNDSNDGERSDSPFRTVDQALSQSGDGDTILIDAGSYPGNISVSIDTNALEIRGASADSTTLKGPLGTTNNTQTNLTIHSLRIKNSSAGGISISDVSSLKINDVVSTGATSHGVELTDVDSGDISHVKSFGAGIQGFEVVSSDSLNFHSIRSEESSEQGIRLEAVTNSNIDSSIFTKNSRNGIHLVDPSSSNLIQNSFANRNTNGISVSGSTNNRFLSNTSDSNTDDGYILESNADNNRFLHNGARRNGSDGFRIKSATGIRLFTNDFRHNTAYQLSIRGSSSLLVQSKNNLIPSGTNPDSGVLNSSGNNLSLERNWFASTDSEVIQTRTNQGSDDNVGYLPYRLAPVDTAPGEDTVAPEAPTDAQADTRFPGEVQLQWNDPGAPEEPSLNDAIEVEGMRLYRSTNPDTTDWKQGLIADLSNSDTDYIDTDIQTNTTYYYRLTAYDSESKFENESFFSPIVKATVPSTGPAIYVNDTEDPEDVFTTNAGNDSNVGIPQHPVRTIEKALKLATPGDTIYIDAGTYGETVAFDTPGLTIIGAGQDITTLQGSGGDSPGIHARGNDLRMRSFRVDGYGNDGIRLDGVENARLTNLTVVNNNRHGVNFTNGANNNYAAQNTLHSNGRNQVQFDGSAGSGNVLEHNNLFGDTYVGQSGIADTAGGNNVNHNWWTTTDSSVIRSLTTGTPDYIPHRLGKVDTGVSADSLPPAVPDVAIDTSVPGELSLTWSEISTDEDGSSLTGLNEFRVYRIRGTGDTTDWIPNQFATVSAGDTSFTDTTVIKSQPYSYRVTAVDTHTPENQSYFSNVRSGTWFNRAPIADTASVITQVDSAVDVTVSGTDPDGDTISFHLDQPPGDGTLSGTLPNVIYEPDAGDTGVDTFTFVTTDGSDTSTPGTVTIDVATNLQINVKNLRTTASETPAIANGNDTIGVHVTFQNSGTGGGIVLRDTDQLRIRNGLGHNVADSFNVSLSGTDVLVPKGDTALATWIIDAPSSPSNPSNSAVELIGNFRTGLSPNQVELEDAISSNIQTLADTASNRRLKPFQITNTPDTFDPGATDRNIDVINTFSQSLIFNGGTVNDNSLFDFTSVSASDGDSVFVDMQRGEANTLDTPILNPALGINTEKNFQSAVAEADQDLKDNTLTGTLDFVDTGIISISIWLRQTNGTYLGDPANLNEDVRITVKRVDLPEDVTDPERLEVVKLVDDGGDWTWKTVSASPTYNDGTLSFRVSSDGSDDYAGFSVFRIISSGFSTSGSADETVVYPNPFVPTDGNPETGEYGMGNRQGIHFGAGPDRGFPPGTTIKIYTIRGQQVDQKTTSQGGLIQWDAHTDNGKPAASGVYIYRIEVPGRGTRVGKFAIVR